MPRATLDTGATERFDLQSLPAMNEEDGGWVELRKMSYGQVLERRDMAAKMAVDLGRRGSTQTEDLKITTELIQKRVTEFEFKICIVDHNLEDENGGKLNFRDPTNIWRLDPKIGQEVGELIDDLNQWDADLVGKGSKASEVKSEPALS